MRPIAAIFDITHPEIDSVIIWHDGQRPVAFAYHDGRVKRTTPLTSDGLASQVAETCEAFRIDDGQSMDLVPLGQAVRATSIPGPRRWGN